MSEPDFTVGIEEEYLLVDMETLALAECGPELIAECQSDLGEQVSPEFLKCQIEIGTKPCAGMREARDDLRRLRAGIKLAAERRGLTPIAASCHPFGNWKTQSNTDQNRYNQLRDDLGGVVRRMLICGMHVHVGLGDNALRADLMSQMGYFLPHMLALSCSSPFWQGEDTKLGSYRISVFDNLPRTGLPPQFQSWEEYERSVEALVKLGVIEDASKIWWDLRPSAAYPTLETRICDVQPRMEHALSLAALTQCLARMLWRLRTNNQRWRRYDPFLVQENRWRAQRYGVTEGLIDFGRGEIVAIPDLIEELIDLVEEDAGVLGCVREIERLREMALETSSDRQRAVLRQADAAGADQNERLRAVVSHLIDEYSADL